MCSLTSLSLISLIFLCLDKKKIEQIFEQDLFCIIVILKRKIMDVRNPSTQLQVDI